MNTDPRVTFVGFGASQDGPSERTELFDFESIEPMRRGRIEKHLAQQIRYNGDVITNAEFYRRIAPGVVGKHVYLESSETSYKRRAVYEVVMGDETMYDIPKMLFDVCTAPEQ